MNIERNTFASWAASQIGDENFNEQDKLALGQKADSIFDMADYNNDGKLNTKEASNAQNIFSKILNFVLKSRMVLSPEEGGSVEELLNKADIALSHADKMPVLDEDFNPVENQEGQLNDRKISGNEVQQYNSIQRSLFNANMEASRLAPYNLQFHPSNPNIATINVGGTTDSNGENVVIKKNTDGSYTIIRGNRGASSSELEFKTYNSLDALMHDLENLGNVDPPFGTYKGLDIDAIDDYQF